MHARHIQEVLAEGRLCDTLHERLRMASCHYVFNKWMLADVERPDGLRLRLVSGGKAIGLPALLRLRVPLELKCVKDAPGSWRLLASPMPLYASTFR